MNIWFVKTTLVFNARKLKFDFLKKIYIRVMYWLKYRYKYMENLPLSFENLFVLLEYNNYKIDKDDLVIRNNIKLKNIIYIDNEDYSIRIDMDKISWNMNIRVKDLDTNNIYYLEHNLKQNLEIIFPKKEKLYKLFDNIFKSLFDNFMKE